MINKSTNKKTTWIFIIGLIFIMGCGTILLLKNRIPNQVQIAAGQENDINLSLGSFIEEEIIEAGNQRTSNIPEGAVHIRCSLFGVIPIKDVEANVVERAYVSPSGLPVGIYMKTEGILVVGTGSVGGMDGLEYEPALNIVHSGDYIVAVNGVDIQDKEDLIECVNQCEGQEIILNVRRNDDLINLKLLPVMTGESEYKLGLWVRDDTQGIGTLTYVDSEGKFGALGHGVSDVDTNTILSLSKGQLYHTDILSVTKGERGIPGELSGVIRYQDDLIIGTIHKNSDSGIFGTLDKEKEGFSNLAPVEIAYKQEITTGAASILCAIDGEIEEYEVEIQKININSKEKNKSMILKITDPRLLEKTGGIVQGMSGSPILQNGRLIGAVTHVFIQDSTSGFGIFIENMLCVD